LVCHRKKQPVSSLLSRKKRGYNTGVAKAEKIKRISDSLTVDKGWPTIPNLVAIGAKILSEETPRIVELDGRVFCEGLLDSFISEISEASKKGTTKH